MDSADYTFLVKCNKIISLLESLDKKLSRLEAPKDEERRLAIDPKGQLPDLWIKPGGCLPPGYRWF